MAFQIGREMGAYLTGGAETMYHFAVKMMMR